MEKNDLFLSERLRNGEKIICRKCKKGHYTTDASDISHSHFFYCDKCNSIVNIDDNVIVE